MMEEKRHKLALVVGNDIYPAPYRSLSKATSDAGDVAGFLKHRLGFRVVQLHNKPAAEVERALSSLVKELTDDSLFFFYFAGHGLCVGSSSKQSLLCADASELLLDGVVSANGSISPEALAAISRRGRGDMFFCLDVCRTQTLRQKSGVEIQKGGAGLRDAVTRPNGKRGTVRGRRLTLSSCADGQGANDDGAFASALIDEMTRLLDGGYELKLGDELVEAVTKRLQLGQTPVLDGERFVLVPGTRAPVVAPASERQDEPKPDVSAAETPIRLTTEANAALQAGRFDDAERLASEALRLDPSFDWATYVLTKARKKLEERREEDRRRREFDQILNEAWRRLNEGDAEGALTRAETVLKERSTDASALELKERASALLSGRKTVPKEPPPENELSPKELQPESESTEIAPPPEEESPPTDDEAIGVRAQIFRTLRSTFPVAMTIAVALVVLLSILPPTDCRRRAYDYKDEPVVVNDVATSVSVFDEADEKAPNASKPWSESSSRKAGTRQTLKIGNAEYGFCWIPAGEFDMGSPPSEEDRFEDETLHHVKLTKGFWMLETEVTQALYQEVTRTNPSEFKGDDLPVETVSWDDATKFCEELTKRLPKGLKASLPTESQWEYACRAGTTTPYSFGSVLNGDKANCDGNYPCGTTTKGRCVDETTPVKSYQPNNWGLYDMHGNVCEWCLDYNDVYPTETVIDPKGPAPSFDLSECVNRGGSWDLDACFSRSACRGSDFPDTWDSWLGFRFLLSCDMDDQGVENDDDYFDETASVADAVSELRPNNQDSLNLQVQIEQKTWSESSNRKAGTRQTLTIGNAEYGFCWIPSGEFDMGSSESDREKLLSKAKGWMGPPLIFDEKLHHVKLTNGFWMLETEVTQALYQEVMGENPSRFKGDNLPVECVSWDDATKFCEELTKRLPRGLRASLPTESQWEYACRAGTTTPYSFGSVLNRYEAHCKGFGGGFFSVDEHHKLLEYEGKTTPVKWYQPNDWGLYDMYGNVWEWCLDYYDEDYPTGTVIDPKGPSSASDRVLRGGGWNDDAMDCRSANRFRLPSGGRGRSLGFRFLLSFGADSQDAYAEVGVSTDAEDSEEAMDVEPSVVELVSDVAASIPVFDEAGEKAPNASKSWSESSSRKAGTRQTLKIGNAEYGFCWIPAGEFDMGSPLSEEDRGDDEKLHHVKLTKGFWLLETETTQALYRDVMGENPSYFKGDDLPVEKVSWDKATKFCEELTKRLPKGMRASLPTESQWEYACRAGTTTPYSFGSALNGDKANCNGNYPYGTTTNGKYLEKTKAVKSYATNAWGLYDMHGNVCEWCLDYYDNDYPTGTVTDPKGPTFASARVNRGGDWFSGGWGCRSAVREGDSSDYRNFSLGFRFLLVCD